MRPYVHADCIPMAHQLRMSPRRRKKFRQWLEAALKARTHQRSVQKFAVERVPTIPWDRAWRLIAGVD